ncbi:glycoside hydrolase family 95 protein [Aspergillus lucknowensis]|uniref:Six-hairpin glycosidase-like protein n=1 Tax=Aspergillus lucknowensis TaxID=176173 RepID=A0ABR4LEI3_9EURO
MSRAFAVLSLIWVEALLVAAASDASHTLWYPQPAESDFFDALPIGNGRLGAMIHGYTDRELITLNEETIWSGGPISNIPPDGPSNLEPLREQIIAGNLTEAGETWAAHFTPEYDDMRRYQPAGELRIDTGHLASRTSLYKRSLDISNGIASVSYDYANVTYKREAFGNFPHNILAFKLSANNPGTLSFDVALSRDRNVTKVSADKSDSLLLYGTGEEDDTHRFASKARLVLDGKRCIPGTLERQVLISKDAGTVHSNSTALRVRGATEVWIVYSVETAHHHPNATVDELATIVDTRLDAVIEHGYAPLRVEAADDYQQYYNRSSIDLGTSGDIGQQDLLQRISNWKNGNNITSDPELMSLQFNYGKYLLIQSSRPGTLPANLQGIWNREFNPAWDSKFTININLEMNYWLAQPLGMPEIAEPVIDLLDRISATGREVATRLYGAEGWCCHHNTDSSGNCMPYHGLTIAAPYPLGGAWLAFEAIEHYRFTGDQDFARNRVLPLLKGILDFIYSWAVEQDGYWITNPSCSPENSYYIPEGMSVAGETTGIDAGAMNDRAIMHEITQGFVEISTALGLDEGVDKAIAFRDKIQGPVAGSFGQILEYSREYEENEPGHRHLSPLVGVHPGTWTTPLTTPEDAAKACTLLRHRMDNGGGGNSWAVTWASVMSARLFDAEHALQYAMELDTRWVFNNLFSRNGGYFQIDGNSGFTAAIIEMFLQSHAGVVHLGPAITSRGLSTGSFKGWIARGGFRVDMSWENGAVTGAEITSLLGNTLNIRVGNGTGFNVNGAEQRGEIETTVGQKIYISV